MWQNRFSFEAATRRTVYLYIVYWQVWGGVGGGGGGGVTVRMLPKNKESKLVGKEVLADVETVCLQPFASDAADPARPMGERPWRPCIADSPDGMLSFIMYPRPSKACLCDKGLTHILPNSRHVYLHNAYYTLKKLEEYDEKCAWRKNSEEQDNNFETIK